MNSGSGSKCVTWTSFVMSTGCSFLMCEMNELGQLSAFHAQLGIRITWRDCEIRLPRRTKSQSSRTALGNPNYNALPWVVVMQPIRATRCSLQTWKGGPGNIEHSEGVENLDSSRKSISRSSTPRWSLSKTAIHDSPSPIPPSISNPFVFPCFMFKSSWLPNRGVNPHSGVREACLSISQAHVRPLWLPIFLAVIHYFLG